MRFGIRHGQHGAVRADRHPCVLGAILNVQRADVDPLNPSLRTLTVKKLSQKQTLPRTGLTAAEESAVTRSGACDPYKEDIRNTNVTAACKDCGTIGMGGGTVAKAAAPRPVMGAACVQDIVKRWNDTLVC